MIRSCTCRSCGPVIVDHGIAEQIFPQPPLELAEFFIYTTLRLKTGNIFFSQAGQSCIIFCHTYGYSTPSLSNACFTIIFFLTATLFPKVMEAIRTYAKKAKGSFGFFCFYKGCVNSDFAAEIWMSSTNSFTKL